MKSLAFVMMALMASFGAHAASVAEYNKRIDELRPSVEPSRQAPPLTELPGPMGNVQQYFRRLSHEQDNLTFRDYARMRVGYTQIYGMAVEMASDADLSEAQKFKLLETLTAELGSSIEKLTEPYMDAELPMPVERQRGENAFAFAGRWVWTRFAEAARFTSRDVTSWVNPSDGRGNWSLENLSRHAVGNWGAMKRSRFLKQTAKDLRNLYGAELVAAQKANAYNARLASLVNLVQAYYERDIEPIRFGRAHRMVGRFYLFMGFGYWYLFPYHDIVADFPPFWGERTKLTGVLSVGLGAAAWSLLYATRRGNSGVGFYRVVDDLLRKNDKVVDRMSPTSSDSKLCERLLKTTASR